jgi:catechol 2,3-dioxygenase-like lactoylglutathione lyase family enzyme
MEIDRLDHLVLTVADIEETCRFYEAALGMTRVTFGEGRTALHFGQQKINLHAVGSAIEPRAATPTAGSGDLCFITATPIGEVEAHLASCGVAIEHGPVDQTGALGAMRSVYFRDPDRNLIEVAVYETGA